MEVARGFEEDDFKKIGCAIVVAWLVYALLFIAFWGVVAWGIITWVNGTTAAP